MRRTVAVIWHASFSIIAAGLYFLFVLPRWWELTDHITHTLGTVLRIVTAAVIGLAALPVVFTLLRTRKPEHETPQLALRLLLWSIVAHVLAAVLIAGTAISEIWLSLDRFGPWLFGIYGAAAAIALLGIGAFYLSLIAELPPRPPKPPKPEKQKQRKRFRKKAKGTEEDTEQSDEESAEAAESPTTEAAESPTTETEEPEADETGEDETAEAEAAETEAEPELAGSAAAEQEDEPDTELVLARPRHRMPTGKRRPKNPG
jgi:MFS family permease